MGNLENVLFNPTIDKMILVVVSFLIIYFVVRILRHYAARGIKEVENRYRIRKGLAFLGYLAAILFAITVLGNQLSGFSVMLGVVAAGIAFALQEVIASVAGSLPWRFCNAWPMSSLANTRPKPKICGSI